MVCCGENMEVFIWIIIVLTLHFGFGRITEAVLENMHFLNHSALMDISR